MRVWFLPFIDGFRVMSDLHNPGVGAGLRADGGLKPRRLGSGLGSALFNPGKEEKLISLIPTTLYGHIHPSIHDYYNI